MILEREIGLKKNPDLQNHKNNPQKLNVGFQRGDFLEQENENFLCKLTENGRIMRERGRG